MDYWGLDFVPAFLREINMISIVLRVVAASLIGGILGLGREKKNRPAGFRTYMLVSLGAAMVMMTNQYVCQQFGITDLVRMGSQVVSGVGFLGAGSIIITGKNKVRGITTAAGLWAAACCGLAVGIGFYEGALIGGIVIFLIISFMKGFDESIRSRSHSVELYIEFDSHNPFRDFTDFSRENDLELQDLRIQQYDLEDNILPSIIVTAKSPDLRQSEILKLLRNAPNVRYVEEMQ